MLEHVALRILQIDDDDVGRTGGNGTADLVDVVDHRHMRVAGLTHPGLDDRGADAVLVDDEDGQVRGQHARY